MSLTITTLRKTLMEAAVLPAASLVMLFAVSEAPAADQATGDAKATRILLIGHQPDHPPGTHLYLAECQLLARCLRQSPGVEAIVSDGWPEDSTLLDGVDAMVLYTSPGAELLFGGDHAETVQRLLDEGVGLVALHWATGAHGKEETEVGRRYLQQLGGLFSFAFSGLDVSQSRVEQLDRNHPICRGWSDFDLTDEYYLNLKFLPEAQPLLKVPVQGKGQTVAWVYERAEGNGGRSYGNTLGHFDALFQQPAFRKMLLNGILWTAHCEVPRDGAPSAPRVDGSD